MKSFINIKPILADLYIAKKVEGTNKIFNIMSDLKLQQVINQFNAYQLKNKIKLFKEKIMKLNQKINNKPINLP